MLVSKNGQTVAALSPAATQYMLTIERGHALTEAMDAQAPAIFWLKGSFHNRINPGPSTGMDIALSI
jgi:hypothetical protein